ncbi:nickel pincer cofactor biosynthesis protein LarC [Stieleria mannarensis]|uniref:nickel pincer cofactor biosynthesis protein LarC n=1 Tax=Stieleria mannarensis TaxID=2755585 RepID=UPI00160383E1|nr:nickel pincer cofactor biosynthesis protein LarC [Rhodopirellula sp. JC639]
MTKFAYFDCFSGISGDMTLGALFDLGADPAAIEAAVRSMGLPELSIVTGDVKKCGFRAVSVKIEHPPEHAHRHLHHITDMIDSAGEIEASAKSLAKRIFGHVAVAEAKVHGTTLEKVHFHEVGAIDSIADIVGAAVAITNLGITSAMASPVPTGTGSVKIDHGLVAVPAPATAEILRGIPIAPCSIAKELTTPTGAAILKELCSDFGPIPAMVVDAIGYGAGTMDLPDQANMLRVLLGHRGDGESALQNSHVHHDKVVVLETNLDDATGEQIADCVNRLMDAGALDVTQTPCTMKKGRSGVVLSVITRGDQIAAMEELIFVHTPSIGIRRYPADRETLPRESITIDTSLGPVKAKSVTLPGGKKRVKVEDDDARRLANECSLSTLEIRRLAEATRPND